MYDIECYDDKVGSRAWSASQFQQGGDSLMAAMRAACQSRDPIVIEGLMNTTRDDQPLHTFRLSISLVFVNAVTKRIVDCGAFDCSNFPIEAIFASKRMADVWPQCFHIDDSLIANRIGFCTAEIQTGLNPDRVMLGLASLCSLKGVADSETLQEITDYKGSHVQRLMTIWNDLGTIRQAVQYWSSEFKQSIPKQFEAWRAGLPRALNTDSVQFLVATPHMIYASAERLSKSMMTNTDPAGLIDEIDQIARLILIMASSAFQFYMAGCPNLQRIIDNAGRAS